MDHFHPGCVYGEKRNLEMFAVKQVSAFIPLIFILLQSNMHFHGWPMAKVKQICGKRTAKQPTDPTHAEVHWTEMRMSLELISSCASSRQVTWTGFKALLLHSYLMSSRTQGPQSGRLPTRNLRLTSLAPCTSGEVRWLDISLSIMIDVLVTWHKNCRSRPELDFACRLSAENWANKTLDSSYAQNTIQ